jgi:5-formyltetrahydrofolate cyclo-ligase
MLTKALVRKELRRRRKALSPADHAARSAQAAKFMTRLAQFRHGSRVALTLSFDGECDTAPLIAAARRRGVRLYTPVIVGKRRRRLRFYPLGARTRRGTYGILVPQRTVAPLGPRWFNLIVVPLVGIDPRGRRLGMGGGYYDTAFAFRSRRSAWRGPRLVGFAFDCQRAESVHAEDWDLRLDALATESGLHPFRSD